MIDTSDSDTSEEEEKGMCVVCAEPVATIRPYLICMVCLKSVQNEYGTNALFYKCINCD